MSGSPDRSQSGQPADSDLDAIVARINGVLRRRGLQTAREIGQIVVEAFFDGELANFRRATGKNIGFQKLAEREDLDLTYHQVWTAVSVAAQLEELPPAVGEALSLSHHRELLAICEPDAKRRLAARAVRRGWTRRELAEQVGLWRSELPNNRAGRPPLPGFVKAVRQAERSTQKAREAEPAPPPDEVRSWGLRRTESVLSELEEEIQALKAWQERLRATAAEVRAAGPGRSTAASLPCSQLEDPTDDA